MEILRNYIGIIYNSGIDGGTMGDHGGIIHIIHGVLN